ncbi:MAG: peptidyl-prolyl cis-trans isomerase [Gammaproteobacteria bacterium]|nr:peptidyl-prolyl cis-trans isomerase [Gammaproteobacteria bacterium]
MVAMETNHGRIVVTLNAKSAPVTVQNFLSYVDNGHYDNTIFHRVIDGFVVQGGGFNSKLKEKPTADAIVNESGNGLSNRLGTLAMARTQHPHSATSQFYINLADNTNLNPQPGRWGYCVFGRVVEGWEVIEKISKLKTGAKKPFPKDVPLDDVVIKKAYRLDKIAESASVANPNQGL